MENQPSQSSEQEPRKPLEFQEYKGVVTDMYDIKAWIAWNAEREYAIWEINYEGSVEPPFYRVNWKPYDSDPNPIAPEQWHHVADCSDYDAAVATAEMHYN